MGLTADRYFAFLRAINTGSRRLTNEQVLAPFRSLGFQDVAAYQAAGNVAFLSESMIDAGSIEPALAAAYGFDAPVFIRSSEDLHRIVDQEWFSPEELHGTAGKVQVGFMKATPKPAAVQKALDLVPPEDRVVFAELEWLWLPVAGISGSVLPVAAVEALVGPMTIRTLGTVQRMLAKFPG